VLYEMYKENDYVEYIDWRNGRVCVCVCEYMLIMGDLSRIENVLLVKSVGEET
jgi:hypothetical protein